ncbi:MAG: CotH kinase family protein, partial [Oscillospiraceae bacterium]|nr:CotH kinase family protein [Oscillospiraceae bacterium]
MKKKIISTILLIAMVVSHIPVWGGSDSNGNVSDSGNRRDDSDNPDNPDNPENSKKPSEPQVPFEVKFSHEAGFYSEEFLLELSVPEEYGEDSQIWYTTGEDVTGIVLPAEASRLSRHDGGVTPVPSAPSTLYVEPIVVSIPPDVNVFTVSAIFVGGGKVSQPVTRSYVRGTDVENRFHSDMVVFSLYSDVFGLYDYNDGIFVPGIDRDEWREEYIRINGRAPDPWKWDTELPPTSPANFNRRGRGSERAVHVEMFDSSGERFIAQRAGMRVKGGWSRGTFVYEQKSLEFYARNSYGDRDNFLFPIFGEQYAEDGNLMHRYRRFRLRNGGSDREQSYLRDELSHTLFKQAGFDDVQGHRPAVVFLNGEYYGLSFVKTPRTEDHWRRRYGGEESGFVIIGSNERGSVGCETPGCGRVIPGLGETGGRTPASNVIRCGSSNQCGRVDCEIYQSGLDDGCVENGRCRGTSDWREIRRLVLGSGGEENPDGLDDDKAFAEFCERVDIDNLIHYYALEMYIANV